MPPKRRKTHEERIEAVEEQEAKNTKVFEKERSEAGKTSHKKWVQKDQLIY